MNFGQLNLITGTSLTELRDCLHKFAISTQKAFCLGKVILLCQQFSDTTCVHDYHSKYCWASFTSEEKELSHKANLKASELERKKIHNHVKFRKRLIDVYIKFIQDYKHTINIFHCYVFPITI